METNRKARINGIIFVLTLVVNTLGALGFINGLSQKEISDRYLTLITPSPATFSIWSVIYGLLIAGVLVMIIKKNDPYYQRAVEEITSLFRLSSILNIIWIVAFSFLQVELSVLLILLFAVTLSLIAKKLRKLNDRRRWLLPLAFSLYGGWLFIATVVNTAAALVKIGWDGLAIAPSIWAAVILIGAALLLTGASFLLQNAAYPLPAAWAFWGIYQFHRSAAGFNGQYPMVEVIALSGMAALIVVAGILLIRNRFSVLPLLSERLK